MLDLHSSKAVQDRHSKTLFAKFQRDFGAVRSTVLVGWANHYSSTKQTT
jgi:hypothetical protein